MTAIKDDYIAALSSSTLALFELADMNQSYTEEERNDVGNEDIAAGLLPQVATDAKVDALKIDEIIFDAAVASQNDRNMWNYDNGQKHPFDAATLDQHKNHIHFAVKAS